ncbi:MAG: Flp pilus assembly complex ATPase component TadA [Phycisphaerae bacterium]|nr:Flp pilus assembly complex ATPase component TadA [Phycisphaerae bacterium]
MTGPHLNNPDRTTPALGKGPPRLGDALVEDGLISRDTLERAVASQKGTGCLLGELLVEQGVIPGPTLVRAVASRLGVRGIHLRHGLIDPALLTLVGPDEAERMVAIPIFKLRNQLFVAMAEPQSLPSIDRLRRLTGLDVKPVLALRSNILEYVRKYGAGDVDVDAFLTSLSDANVQVVERETVDEGPAHDLDKMVAGSPIVNLVNIAMLTAVRDGASDIHVEPDKKGTRVRYRIDGVLRELMRPPPGMHAAIISRVKVIGRMDIAEKRLPQEGRVHIVAEGREIDLRVSSIPTLLGEKVVMRILDKANLKVRLEDLGLRPESLAVFRRILHEPYGLVLVTGPTGSGKTTTLYSALDLLRDAETNIVTVEDPVEYQLDMVNQIQVHDGIGMSFARALRSILRQDPDVIMVGEIRDEETARVAVQAALTGHLVLATLHTNDAPSAPSRLIEMGIEPYLLSGALQGVIAQRLARTICPKCSTSYFPSEQVLRDAGLEGMAGKVFRKGVGCRACHDSGFQGRTGVYEVLEVTPLLRRLVHRAASVQEIRSELRDRGWLTLREEGVIIAIEGRTSLEEVLRVTRDDTEDDAANAAPADNLRTRKEAA